MKKSTIIIASIVVLSSLTGCFGGHRADFHSGSALEDLDLTKTQQAKFDKLKTSLKTYFETKKDDKSHQDIANLLDADTLDQTKARTLLDAKTTKTNNKMKTLIPEIADFTDSLTAEQRAKLKQKVGRFEKFGKRRFGRFGH